jgi:hypothetical protein
MPAKVSVDKIKANLLQPALTSHFIVDIPFPKYGTSEGGFGQYLISNGVKFDKEKLRLVVLRGNFARFITSNSRK